MQKSDWKAQVEAVVDAYLKRDGRSETLKHVTPEELFEFLEENFSDFNVGVEHINTNGWQGDWNIYMSEDLVVGGCWWTGNMYIESYVR